MKQTKYVLIKKKIHIIFVSLFVQERKNHVKKKRVKIIRTKHMSYRIQERSKKFMGEIGLYDIISLSMSIG